MSEERLPKQLLAVVWVLPNHAGVSVLPWQKYVSGLLQQYGVGSDAAFEDAIKCKSHVKQQILLNPLALRQVRLMITNTQYGSDDRSRPRNPQTQATSQPEQVAQLIRKLIHEAIKLYCSRNVCDGTYDLLTGEKTVPGGIFLAIGHIYKGLQAAYPSGPPARVAPQSELRSSIGKCISTHNSDIVKKPNSFSNQYWEEFERQSEQWDQRFKAFLASAPDRMAVPQAYAELKKLGTEGPLALARQEKKSKSTINLAAIDDASAEEQLLSAANLAKDMDTAFAAAAKAPGAANGSTKKRNAGDNADERQDKKKKKDKEKGKNNKKRTGTE
eukprot:gene5662-biopygen7457